MMLLRIHREGHILLSVLMVILFSINVSLGLSPLPNWVFFISAAVSAVIFWFFLQFFRNPTRTGERGDNLIVCPADGKVVVVERTHEHEHIDREVIQVSIFMSPLNVHVNRNPIGGTVSYFQYHPGKFLVAWHPKSSTENERTTYVIKADNGKEILLRQIAGAVARRICWYVKPNDKVKQAEEFGFIKFGSRVDVMLPVYAEILVKPGDVVWGGVTTLAKW